MQKGPLCLESLSYQKKDGGTWSCPSFFCFDTDFSKKKQKKTKNPAPKKKCKKSVSYQKKDERGTRIHPSFGMTTTQDVRDIFT